MFKQEIQQICVLIFTILTILVKPEMDLEEKNQEPSDITKDLSDEELKLALSDLSLKDLNTLQKFIDAADYQDLEYQEGDSLINDNSELLNNNDIAEKDDLESMDYYADQNNCNCNCKPQNYKNELFDFTNPQQQNQRMKRDNEKNLLNKEYIKQLSYSFPQNIVENNKNVNAFVPQQNHVRVKRN